MNQQCKVCGEPAAGFHFGAFTCEGCKSFFGRSYNNLSAITECKNNGECIINKKNRTACKSCRLRKCLLVGMSKSGSRYGRRSNWFKIHCLLQEQQQAASMAMASKKDEPYNPFTLMPPSSPESPKSLLPLPPFPPSLFVRPPPFLIHPHLFPFVPPVQVDDPPTNNNYDTKNNNLVGASRKFHLDAILGLNKDSGQDSPIDLSVKCKNNFQVAKDNMDSNDSDDDEENHVDPDRDVDVVSVFPSDDVKPIPLDLSVV